MLTVSGEERVTEVHRARGEGVYTLVTREVRTGMSKMRTRTGEERRGPSSYLHSHIP